MKMHPHSDNIFAYGTDRGGLFLSDMRLVSKPTAFKWENQGRKNFFSQMISSYSSISFINQSKYIACRDYMTIKIWDIAKNDQPLACIPIQSALKSKLCEVFEH